MWLGFNEVAAADAGDAVTITLTDEVDASRGDVLVAADAPPEVADQFEAKLLWMSEHALVPGAPIPHEAGLQGGHRHHYCHLGVRK